MKSEFDIPIREIENIYLMTEATTFSFIANQYKCYPGDKVTFSARVRFKNNAIAFLLEIELSDAFIIEQTVQVPEHISRPTHHLRENCTISWMISQPTIHSEFELMTHLSADTIEKMSVGNAEEQSPEHQDFINLQAIARLTYLDTKKCISESFTILVAKQSMLLRYLPALYEQDTFFNKFLILAESYLRPLQKQIDQFDHTLDPMITPAAQLPWLASWLDWEFEEDWPLDQNQKNDWQRSMIKSLLLLHRQRGTEIGLQQYLELYLGLESGKVQVQSFTLQTFVLNEDAKIGRGIALYKDHRQPHTFEVTISIPPRFVNQRSWISEIKERVSRIIVAEKPAHTVLAALNIVIDPLIIGL